MMSTFGPEWAAVWCSSPVSPGAGVRPNQDVPSDRRGGKQGQPPDGAPGPGGGTLAVPTVDERACPVILAAGVAGPAP